ncbi:hypothetical protein BG46_07185 [Brucella anthropi]|nr:hypothetical protein BG46_07185 [Brucella anthropi]
MVLVPLFPLIAEGMSTDMPSGGARARGDGRGQVPASMAGLRASGTDWKMKTMKTVSRPEKRATLPCAGGA